MHVCKHAHGCDVVSGSVGVVSASAAAVLVDCIVLSGVVLSCVPVLDARVPDVVLGPQIPASMSSVSTTEIKCLPAAGEMTSHIYGRNTIAILYVNTVVLCVVKW